MAAIPVIFYKNTQRLNSPYRTFINPATISGTPRDELDFLNPVITIEYNSAIISSKHNYAYIAEYGRYYYILGITVKGKTMEISFHTDSFYNYRSCILRSECIAERSSSNYELMLEDTAVAAVAGYEVFSRSLPYSFRPDQGTYVLTVAGG